MPRQRFRLARWPNAGHLNLFMIYSFFMAMIIYPLYANWVWGGGWLAKLGSNFGLGHGTLDFAGSSVVHMVGGVAALAGAWLLGPRIGKYKADGTPKAIPGHHIPMAVLGTMILCFGWFGFNAGSTLAGTDLRIGVVAVNTMLASVAGAFSAMIYMWTFSASRIYRCLRMECWQDSWPSQRPAHSLIRFQRSL